MERSHHLSEIELKQLTATVLRHADRDGSFDTKVPGLALYRSSEPTVHDAVVYMPSLCVIAQGAKEVVVTGRAYRYDRAQSLLVSVDMPAATRIVEASPNRPCLAVRVGIDSAVVGELLADGTTVPPLGHPARGIGVTPVEPQLLNAVTRLVALLDTAHDIRALSPLIIREIIHRVLTGPQGARLRQIIAPGTPAQRIARAIGWLKEHYAEPARVEELAKYVALSPSAFHLHFKAVTGLSPLQYQKRFRLQEARRLMLSDGLDAAEAAFRVGYESPSQFGREYRRLFGTPPRQDIVALTNFAQTASPSGV
ncbi:MAG: AraC family transcriptional regulator CmrA [Schlesneria sp.]|nr:AraC family transcriptional regulator CmrA [Schlesneria sp.]